MLEFTFPCPLPNGVHARPASAIEEVARRFESTISVTNERTSQAANARSVLALASAEIRFGDRCVLTVAGPDEREAFDALTRFLEHDFPHSDDVLPPVEVAPRSVQLPRMLQKADGRILPGVGVVSGIGEGRAVAVRAIEVPDSIPTTGVWDIAAEVARVDAALDKVLKGLDARLEQASGAEGTVLKAHRAVARDPEFKQQLHASIRQHAATAAGAIAETEAHFTAVLSGTGSALLRERALDVRDVCAQLLVAVYGKDLAAATVKLSADAVCVADTLTPSQFLALDRRWLRGLVLGHGGTTSHAVILARSFGVPTVVGVAGLASADLDGDVIIVDGDLGVVVADISGSARRYYEFERRRLEALNLRTRRFLTAPAVTADGRRIEVAANIGTAAEAATAFAAGAEGIGLFRTEMLFVDRPSPPTEEEQFTEYRRVLLEADNRPVIIRTLDVGGDKPIPYLHLPQEDNPFLGYRAIRLYPEFDAIFRAQVSALVRASAFGRLKVMAPMISRVEEVRWLKSVVAEEQAKCRQAGIEFDPAMQVGAMVEVPSIAFLLDSLSRDLDFFSIGSNDLLQYFFAVDRANSRVAALSNPLHPAFLRLLKTIVDGARGHGRWVGLCGEMGGQLRALPLLVGLGLDEISMSAPAIPAAKAAMASLSAAACVNLVQQAIGCATTDEVEHLLGAFDAACPAPLIEPDLVLIDGDATTKDEAIKEAVDRLYVVGRTDRPRDLEDAVWRREAVYSTGFGYGFAIPHCKTDAVRASSMTVVKLQTPVEWGSLDEKPVSVLLLLTIRESDSATEHMKVLATLARKLMHDDFRERLLTERDPEAMCQFLRGAVGA